MAESRVWVVNTSKTVIDRVIKNKFLEFHPNRPKQVELYAALDLQKLIGLKIITNPHDYYSKESMSFLIIRDAGIGDLLLLEPILRKLAEDKTKKISILSRYPDVFVNSPYLAENLVMHKKEEVPVDRNKYDALEDLRSYSEDCQRRDIDHRTDCYNQVFSLKMKDKEPRLYFKKSDKSSIEKEEGYTYFAIICDASHEFRRYAKGIELIEYILKADKKNKVVVFGNFNYVKLKPYDRIIDLQGKTTVRESINIIKDAIDYIISVDSGIMHVALTMHKPTLCIFSIIHPQLRMDYYKGEYRILTMKGRRKIVGDREVIINCIGCGSLHMAKCRHVQSGEIAPCLDIDPKEIYDLTMQMKKNNRPRVFYYEKKIKKEKINNVTILPPKLRLIMPIIVLNEEANLPRFIDLVMSHPCISKTIAIDGGSIDNTQQLLRNAGAQVYEHYYDKNYHDMQALQRNISCSFVRDGEKIIIMDIDECFSKELSDYLYQFAEGNIEYGMPSRRTFNYYIDIDNPEKQIKDYPDYQPRMFTWNRRFKWVGSPHHAVLNVPEPVLIDCDIIHFEKENKDRDRLEKDWAEMEAKTKVVYG